MGIIPDPNVATSNHCAPCWPLGDCPHTLKVFFAGIEGAQLSGSAGVPGANGYHDVQAEISNDCYWKTDPPKQIICRVKLGVPSAKVWLEQPGVGSLFNSWDFPSCTRWFENQNLFINKLGYKGWCYVCSSMELIDLYSGFFDPDLYTPRYELFPMADHQVLLRLARITDGTLMHLKIDVS